MCPVFVVACIYFDKVLVESDVDADREGFVWQMIVQQVLGCQSSRLKECQGDRSIVLAAVSQNGLALEHAAKVAKQTTRIFIQDP
eukprot:5120732-Amphidinium_carterae.1